MSNRPLNVGLIGGGKGASLLTLIKEQFTLDGTRRVLPAHCFLTRKLH
jgi:hypothetical protein